MLKYNGAAQELMARMFLVNIPMVFSAVWRVLSVFVDERVRAKIRFLTSKDIHILKDYIDEDVLPSYLGGSKQGKCLSDKEG